MVFIFISLFLIDVAVAIKLKKGVCSLKTSHPAQVSKLTYRHASSAAKVLTLVDQFMSVEEVLSERKIFVLAC